MLPYEAWTATWRNPAVAAAVFSATIVLGSAVLLRLAIDALQRHPRASKSKLASFVGGSSIVDGDAKEEAIIEDDHRGVVANQPDQLAADKELYHRLHNLHLFPEAIPAAHDRLLSLLDETIAASTRSPAGSIQEAVPSYSRTKIEAFLSRCHDVTSEKYAAYIARRRAGGPREMFKDRETALWWLKNSAPVKYVDGTWIAHVHKITEKFKERPACAIAWQVMSEELGDGTLAKNHVYVYEELMRSLGCVH